MGDDLIPDEITHLLGHHPTSARAKGEISYGKSGKRNVSHIGIWILNAVDHEPGDPDAQIREILAKLSGDLDMWCGLTARYRTDVFFGIFMHEPNEGFSLAPSSLLSLGSRGITADFDVYAHG